jgi:hypothetical protein
LVEIEVKFFNLNLIPMENVNLKTHGIVIFFIFSIMASACAPKYTASFNSVPAKDYANSSSQAATTSHDLETQEIAIIQEADIAPEKLMVSAEEVLVDQPAKEINLEKSFQKLAEMTNEAKDIKAEPVLKELSWKERIMLHKANKKLAKVLDKKDIKDIKDVQATQFRGSNMVYFGIILLIAGVLVAWLIPGAGGLIGSIAAGLGVLLIILGLLA